jgi:hypothetical protein
LLSIIDKLDWIKHQEENPSFGWNIHKEICQHGSALLNVVVVGNKTFLEIPQVQTLKESAQPKS